MKKATEVTFLQHNLRLVNLAEVIKTEAQINLINHLSFYELLAVGRLTKDIRKFFYHNIAMSVCEVYLKHTALEKCVLFFNPKELNDLEVFSHIPEDKARPEIVRIIRHLNKILPVKILESTFLFVSAVYHMDMSTGEGVELVSNIKALIDKALDNFTFAQALKHTLREELTTLNKELSSTARYKLLTA